MESKGSVYSKAREQESKDSLFLQSIQQFYTKTKNGFCL